MDINDHDHDAETALATPQFEKALLATGQEHYAFRLYVLGHTTRSIDAIRNTRLLCEEYLKDRYSLYVINIAQHPHLAEAHQLIAAPTLIRFLPLPVRRLIGDMSIKDKFLASLRIMPQI